MNIFHLLSTSYSFCEINIYHFVSIVCSSLWIFVFRQYHYYLSFIEEHIDCIYIVWIIWWYICLKTPTTSFVKAFKNWQVVLFFFPYTTIDFDLTKYYTQFVIINHTKRFSKPIKLTYPTGTNPLIIFWIEHFWRIEKIISSVVIN